MFASTSSLSWPQILAIARTYIPTIRKLTPSLWEEIEGIALGADVEAEEIVALNCRSEIALGMFDGDGCTALGWKLHEGRMGEKEVILAQNWDWVAPVKENLVMMCIEQEGQPKIWMVTEVCLLSIGIELWKTERFADNKGVGWHRRQNRIQLLLGRNKS